jgi:transcription-repair coupling factor (superfamily II helicase)
LIEKLVAAATCAKNRLKNVGEFSVRGGILGCLVADAEMPVRIEFFGDTVDSIREFDPETQLSVGQLKEIFLSRRCANLPRRAKDFRIGRFSRAKDSRTKNLHAPLKDRTQFADEGESFSGWEFLIRSSIPRKSERFRLSERLRFRR